MAAQNERRISHMKRFLALLLGALMVLSLLTACGGGTPEKPTSPPETQISAGERR